MKNPAAMMSWDSGTLETYAALVTRLDYQVGRIVEAVRSLGIGDDTVIVFTSDNGGERFSDTWPFSGKKGELLEGGLRVPAIVVWPGQTRPGSECSDPIISMDWLPTFVSAAGAAPDPAYPSDGIDIRPALAGRSLPPRDLYWRYKFQNQQAMRRENWKYLEIGANAFLFDVVKDPLERANLKVRQPEVFKELHTAWQAWNTQMLPLDPLSATHAFTGDVMADHPGVKPQR